MKKSMGMLICVLLTGMILWAAEPGLLYGAETPEGDVWDQFVDPGPYPKIILAGPLSIYYDIQLDQYCMGGSSYTTTMYYTVRLTKNGELDTFQGKAQGVCLADFETQGTVIKDNFLGGVVVPGIFPKFKSWKLKSIANAQFHDDDVSRAFVADIEIAVKK